MEARTAAQDNPIEAVDPTSDGARGDHPIRPQPERQRDRQPE
jgi:hypothetical protein